ESFEPNNYCQSSASVQRRRVGEQMSNQTVGSKTVKQNQVDRGREQPAHPALKANLLMAGVVLLLLILAVASTVGAR
nr:hypothetical protein [Ilumatobacteraceae bacterium]